MVRKVFISIALGILYGIFDTPPDRLEFGPARRERTRRMTDIPDRYWKRGLDHLNIYARSTLY